MIIYQRESIKDIKDELEPLLLEHKDEVAVYDFLDLDVDWGRYVEGDERDSVVTFTVRSDGELVGYAAYFVSQSLHYSKEKYAVMDVIYLAPEYREAGIGVSLLKFAEEYLTEEFDVSLMTIHMKVWAPFEGVAKHLGYELKEYMYTKYVGEQHGS